MGCYDTVVVPCPKCGEEYFAQSKGGYCLLYEYPLDKAPDDVLSDVNRHAPFTCYKCRTKFEVKDERKTAKIKVVEVKEDQNAEQESG
jgi:hypothetical protein